MMKMINVMAAVDVVVVIVIDVLALTWVVEEEYVASGAQVGASLADDHHHHPYQLLGYLEVWIEHYLHSIVVPIVVDFCDADMMGSLGVVNGVDQHNWLILVFYGGPLIPLSLIQFVAYYSRVVLIFVVVLELVLY